MDFSIRRLAPTLAGVATTGDVGKAAHVVVSSKIDTEGGSSVTSFRRPEGQRHCDQGSRDRNGGYFDGVAIMFAAEYILAVERLCDSNKAVGTVGHQKIEPNASNVIPGRVRFSVDIRFPRSTPRR